MKKELLKSETDKKITGVCGGLANYFGISAAIIRAVFLFGLIGGIAMAGVPTMLTIVVYVILMVVM